MKKIIYTLLLVFLSGNITAQTSLPGSGNAFSFDGIDDALSATQQTNVFDNFTIEAWINPVATTQTYTQSLYGTEGSYGTNRYLLFPPHGAFFGDPFTLASAGITAGTNGICVFEHSHYYMPAILSWSGNISGWTHIAIVYTNKQPRLYVNGILVATGLISTRARVYAATSQFFGGAYGYYQGQADEIKIWNKSLTQTQIRERMCKKITPSDVLFSNLVAYYNFDKMEYYELTVIDRSLSANNGLFSGKPEMIVSGAAIGNASAFNYVTSGLPASSLSFNGQDQMNIACTNGTYIGEAGTQLYVVNEKPNTQNGMVGFGTNDRYFGVFNANISSANYSAVYNYSNNPFVNSINEPDIRLFNRPYNNSANWFNASAANNLTANTLSITGLRGEFMLGSKQCGFEELVISANGPTSFCDPQRVTLTAPTAYSYTWSNEHITQSISVAANAVFKVTVSNAFGCSTTSGGVAVTLKDCIPDYCTASATGNANGYIANVSACYGFNNSTRWNGYGDFTSQSVSIAPGKILGLSVTPDYVFANTPMYIKAWIDWNGDHDFADIGETVFAPSIPINVKTKFWVTVPAGTTPGSKRLRVALRADMSPARCGTFTYGDVEDYTIKIVAARPVASIAEDDLLNDAGNNFMIYPNPAGNQVTFERSGYNESVAKSNPAQITFTDVNGRVVMQAKLTGLVQTIDVSKIANGIYFVTIISNKNSSTHKIIISH